MKPKPILFSTPMVQAYLEDRKEMTRRIAKFPKDYSGGTVYPNGSFGLKYAISDGTIHRLHAKYQPGDILWVRETWSINDFGEVAYRADGDEFIDGDGFTWIPKWKPSIHMPYEAARIFLEVTNVRCERLQDISEEDAIAEGIEVEPCQGYNSLYPPDPKFMGKKYDYPKAYKGQKNTMLTPIESFKSLWRSINGPDSWEANPWVFVYTFKRAEKPSLL